MATPRPAAGCTAGLPAFVVGSGRCGSTLLSSMLRLHPALLSISELLSMTGGPRVLLHGVISAEQFWAELVELTPDMRCLLALTSIPEVLADPRATPLARLSALELVTLPHLTTDPAGLLARLREYVRSGPPSRPAAHLSRMLGWLCQRYARRLWVERSGGSLEYVDVLTTNWPTARVVYLTRDGRDTACSMAGHPMFRVHLARILSGDPSLSVAACLRLELPVDRFGAYWSALVLKAQRSLRALPPGQVYVVRYEQLVAEPGQVLAGLSQFLTREPAAPAWLEAAAQRVRSAPPRWTELPTAARERLEAACRPGMRCLRDL